MLTTTESVLPPGLNGFPLFGNALAFRRSPTRFLSYMHYHFGDAFSFRLFNTQAVYLHGTDAIRWLLTQPTSLSASMSAPAQGVLDQFHFKSLDYDPDSVNHPNKSDSKKPLNLAAAVSDLRILVNRCDQSKTLDAHYSVSFAVINALTQASKIQCYELARLVVAYNTSSNYFQAKRRLTELALALTQADRSFQLDQRILARRLAEVCSVTSNTIQAFVDRRLTAVKGDSDFRRQLCEATRLHPPGNFFRLRTTATTSYKNWSFAPNTDVYVSPLLSQRDARVWDYPEIFAPQRFDSDTSSDKLFALGSSGQPLFYDTLIVACAEVVCHGTLAKSSIPASPSTPLPKPQEKVA